ncbi:uncharacterized protein LOC129738006 [Uranotaenia lowii]|uniref:uncharacterized protein LOC129738006 n=1 Tax=Uranotaenia lowii TaxID=190385 RepID=UPI0024799109|nr:uncharacterized protein LOC129738006 [Uranotaenia lowii]
MQSSSTPNNSEEYSCVACDRPDSADNFVACDQCNQWWHYTCAGVTDSIKERPWTCPRCLPTPAASVTTTSSRRTRLELSLRHLEHQREIAERRLDLENQFMQERFRLMVESLSDEENRSVRSRVDAIETRERNSQISQWIRNQDVGIRDPQGPKENDILPVAGNPPEIEGAIGGQLPPSEPITNQQSSRSNQIIKALEQQLQKCQMRPQADVDDIRELEAKLIELKNQIRGHHNSLPNTMSAVDPPTQPDVSKGAIRKKPTRRLPNYQSGYQKLPPPTTQPITIAQHRVDNNPQPTNDVLASWNPSADPAAKNIHSVSNKPDEDYQLRSTHPVPICGGLDPIPHMGAGTGQRQYITERNYTPRFNLNAGQPAPPEPSNSGPQATSRVLFGSEVAPLRICRPNTEQLAARQITRELPEFSGNPEDWPLFINSYTNTTSMCGYNNAENLVRLQRSLKGNALNSVRSYLFSPDSVPEVIETLQILYGRPELIINRLIKNVRAVPTPKAERLETLMDFGITVRNLIQHLIASGHRTHLSNPSLLQELVEKLPANFQYEWSQQLLITPDADLSIFSGFMAHVVQSVSKVVTYTGSQGHRAERNRTRENHFVHTHIEAEASRNENRGITCFCCQESGHRVKDCRTFKNDTVEDRWRCVNETNLCRTCLGMHGRRPCRLTNRCGVDGCNRRHHPLLHSPSQNPENTNRQMNTENLSHHHCGQSVLYRIMPITVHGSARSLTVCAFFDEGSSATLLEKQLAQELGIEGPTVPLCLKWTADVTRSEEDSQLVSLHVSEVGKDTRFHIENVRTVKCLNLPSQTLRFTDLEDSYDHLRGLPVISYENETPKILIGLRHLKLAIPRKLKEGTTGPTACKTQLGWCVYGDVGRSRDPEYLNYNLCECSKLDGLDTLVREYFNREDCGVNLNAMLESAEDSRARQILENSTQWNNGRYQTELLWRYDKFQLPDSYAMAKSRLMCLERRMQRDQQLKENIHDQIHNYQIKGYAHRATQDELDAADPNRVWYLPLGAVVNPKKKGKVRLIWDAAASVNGVSLNSFLLAGPDLLTPLASVLFRFRQFPVAISGDLREMFHQIEVAEKDRHSQRFLWRENPNQEPEIFLMDVATFGAKSSPSTAQYVKNRNAMQFESQYPRAVEGICRSTYVDDYLDSFETCEEGKKVAKEVKRIHSHGGFEIRNWASNVKEILEHLGEETNNMVKDLATTNDNIERVLGLLWEPQGDNLSFSTTFRKDIAALVALNSKPTKRQVLKCLMSLFDPLGLLASYLIHGKVLMQDIWRTGIKWDEPINDDIFRRWKVWIESLDRLGTIKIPRCYFPDATKSLYDSLQAHVFVDASEVAYSAVLYFRVRNPDGTFQCTLVAAKTKVTPLKYVSIPRSELNAAVLGTRLMTFVTEGHSIPIHDRFYWTDSNTVLSWISSDHRRYRSYVACRVGEILRVSTEKEWNWVPSKFNVADIATKWGNGPNFDTDSSWFRGPSFLYTDEEPWVKPDLSATTEEELKPVHIHQEIIHPTLINFDNFSKWNVLLRSTALVFRFAALAKRKTVPEEIISQEHLKQAQNLLWKLAQGDSYQKEITQLKNAKHNAVSGESKKFLQIEKHSPLYKLTPLLDEFGVLRVDGRIGVSDAVSNDVKFPVILPRNHRVTFLIIDHYHQKFLHGNTETVVNELRQKFEIPRLRVEVRKVANNCQWCKIYKSKPEIPRMAPLPRARLAAGVRPFTFVGVDYFGPIPVKRGRANVKRWICLFTCLTVRAVHVEVAYDLTTQSCISCFRRFIGRRGPPLEIYSDNGRNFYGASRILQDQMENINKKISAAFTDAETKWIFIPPSAPHMGGAWERLVRSIKQAMLNLPLDSTLDDEGLHTLSVEAESMVNSRPLTYLPLYSEESEAITPNHFLLRNSNGKKIASENHNDNPLVLRDAWDSDQGHLKMLWKRWVREYMPTLTKRTKWFGDTKPVETNDIVIVIDESRRNGWIRGKVLDVAHGKDGRVREAMVQTSGGILRRPVAKIAVLDVDVSGKVPYGEGNVDATGIPDDEKKEEKQNVRIASN